jgi:hypothetical protein
MIATEEETPTNQPVECAPVSNGANAGAAPTLQDAEERVAITLRCAVRPLYSGGYIAECIDLDISVEEPTLESAISGLQDAMIGYLHVVLDGQGTNAVASLRRPSPLSHRIWYYIGYMRCKLLAPLRQRQAPPARKFYEFSPSPRLIRSHCCA